MKNQVTHGKSTLLSARETQLLGMIATGMTSKEVATELCVAKCTVDFHLERIYKKLNANNRMHAVHLATRLGILGDFTGQNTGFSA